MVLRVALSVVVFCQLQLSHALQSQIRAEAKRRLHQELFQPPTNERVQIHDFNNSWADVVAQQADMNEGVAAHAATSHHDENRTSDFGMYVSKDQADTLAWDLHDHENNSAIICADNDALPRLENGTIKCASNVSRGSYAAPLAEYISAGYWPLLREDGAAEFVNSFSPTRLLSSEAWAWLPNHVAFNPALVRLPLRLARSLHPLAHYVVAVRHGSGQCDRLGNNSDTTMRSVDSLQDSSLLLLDASLNPLTFAARIRGTDMRLFVVGDQILATFVHAFGRSHVRFLDLWIDQTATFRANYILPDSTFEVGARNVGLMTRNGTDGPELLALWWLGDNANNEQNDVRPLQDLTTVELGLNRKQDDFALRTLHNNINPVYLLEEEAYLAVGHQHYRYNGHRSDVESMRLPKYGHEYVHYFLLIDHEPPFATKFMSPPFCVPATKNFSACEVVQFITSATRDGDDLLLSYGINDCEAGIFRVPLADVLHFTRRHVTRNLGWQLETHILNVTSF